MLANALFWVGVTVIGGILGATLVATLIDAYARLGAPGLIFGAVLFGSVACVIAGIYLKFKQDT